MGLAREGEGGKGEGGVCRVCVDFQTGSWGEEIEEMEGMGGDGRGGVGESHGTKKVQSRLIIIVANAPKSSPSGNRTPGPRVRGVNVSHYTKGDEEDESIQTLR